MPDLRLDHRYADPATAWLAAAADVVPGEAGDRYRRCLAAAIGSGPDWVAVWDPLIAAQFARPAILAAEFYRHSATEEIGAVTIAHVGARSGDPALEASMERHARDERRHCRMFAALAAHIAPDEPDRFAGLRAENDAFLEEFGGDVGWFLCDTHVAELRNLALLGCYVRAAAASGAEPYVRASLERIFDDEWRHVTYTAPYVAAVLGRSDADQAEFVATLHRYADDAMVDADRVRHDLEEMSPC